MRGKGEREIPPGEHPNLKSLINALDGGRVVVFAGAGVSLAATGGDPLSSWKGLLKNGIDHATSVAKVSTELAEAMRILLEEGEFLIVAELVTKALDGPLGGVYANWLERTVGALSVREGGLPQALDGLGVPLVTTNYDDILHTVTGRTTITSRDAADVARFMRFDGSTILHLHGHWRRPESVVLGLRSYEEILRDPKVPDMLRALFLSRSLVFVGYGKGLYDPNLGALRDWFGAVHNSSPDAHYVLVRREDEDWARTEFDPSRRILPVIYGDTYEELPGFLNLVRSSRSTVSGCSDGQSASKEIHYAHPRSGQRFFGRESELERIRVAVAEKAAAVVVLTGIGGSGKSMLLENFLLDLDPSDFDAVFVWSFTWESDPDRFFRECYRYFVEDEPEPGATCMELCAKLRNELASPGRRLLALDGLEALQDVSPEAQRFGEVTDVALRTLLVCSSESANGTAVIATSRFSVPELRERDRYCEIDVGTLEERPALEIMKAAGVEFEVRKLQSLVELYGAHPLILSLVSAYVAQFGDPLHGDLMDRSSAVPVSALDFGKRLEAILGSYAAKLTPEAENVISCLCVLGQGADQHLIAQTLREVDSGSSMSPSNLRKAIHLLSELRLVEHETLPEEPVFSVHPAVRDYFWSRIPSSRRDRLHTSVADRIAAGVTSKPRSSEALGAAESVVYHRVRAGNAVSAYQDYVKLLGGIRHLGWDLGQFPRGERVTGLLVSDSRASNSAQALSPTERATILKHRGHYLDFLGRYESAESCLRECAAISLQTADWGNLSDSKRNLGLLLFLRGQLVTARTEMAEALEYAARVGVEALMDSHAYCGLVQMLLGDSTASLMSFEESRRCQNEMDGNDRGLYSFRATWYGYLLVRLGRTDEALKLLSRKPSLGKDVFHWNLLKCGIQRARGHTDLSRKHLRDAREFVDRAGWIEGNCRCAVLEARLLKAEGEHEKAIESARAAITIAREHGLDILLSEALVVAAGFELHGRLDAAEAMACEALEIASGPGCGYRSGQADALQLVARILWQRALENDGSSRRPRLLDAQSHLRRSAEIREAMGDHRLRFTLELLEELSSVLHSA